MSNYNEMSEISITKIFKFDSAHYLPHHDGKCANIHGHTYELHITISGSISSNGSSKGMIMDFGKLKEIVNDQVISKFDHKYLNEIMKNPTAEETCLIIADLLKPYINDKDNLFLKRIRLYETPTSYCEITFSKD